MPKKRDVHSFDRAHPLTTGEARKKVLQSAGMRRAASPLLAPGVLVSNSQTPRDQSITVTDAFPALITKPVMPPVSRTPFGELPYGLYLMAAPPGTGKSIAGMALSLYINEASARDSAVGRARYVSVSEPRSPETSISNNLNTFISYIQLPDTAFSTTVKICVVDSIGYAMRAYSGDDSVGIRRGATGSMEQGMDVADQHFCRVLQNWARNNGVMIGIVGEKEVPFVDSLEGLVEGLIRIVDLAPNTDLRLEIIFRGRLTPENVGRTWQEVTIPSPYVALAAKYLQY